MALGSAWARLRGATLSSRDVAKHLLGFALWIPVIVQFKTHVYDLSAVSGASMYPFINEDKDKTTKRDWFLNYKWAPSSDLQRGMIVTLWSPMHPESTAVKRIIALEGDIVRTKSPYPFPTIKVPPGHVWIEGDGDKTLDSNTYGPVSKNLITGKITHVLLPLRKFGPVKWWESQPLISHRVSRDDTLVQDGPW